MNDLKQNIDDIIYLIQESPLDDFIKEILIRDVRAEGLTPFLREQILAYCDEGLKIANMQIQRAKISLEEKTEI